MGSTVEINDTLQITRAQGFPAELSMERHTMSPLTAGDFEGRIFSFRDKKDIRCYQQPPVRCFLVENNGGEWIYWGQVFVLSVMHDYIANTTSGTYRIVRIYAPDDMKTAKSLIEFREEQ